MTSTAPASDFEPSTQQVDTQHQSPDALPIGTRLGGYQIVDTLGYDDFGIVYLALDASLQRQVAIKEYLPTEMAQRRHGLHLELKPGTSPTRFASGVAAFLAEAKLLARVDHPALARVQSFWEENRTAYVVSGYYSGQSLADYLHATPEPPSEKTLRAWLTPLLEALGLLHAAQYHHLNISPDNILLLHDEKPVLLGLGAPPQLPNEQSALTAPVLNHGFAAIEQYTRTATIRVGAWTDIYALAGVVYLAITGQQPPPASERAIEDNLLPLADAVQQLRARFPTLAYSASFMAGIDKALSLKPKDRPRSATEFLQALDHVPDIPSAAESSDKAPAARQKNIDSEIVFAARVAPPHRRTHLRWMLVAATLLVLLCATAAWWWSAKTPASSASQSSASPTSAASSEALERQEDAAVTPWVAYPPTLASAPSATAASSTPLSDDSSPVESPSPEAASAPPTHAPLAEPVPKKKSNATSSSHRTLTKRKVDVVFESPRQACEPRSNFSLLYCMARRCDQPEYTKHPECIELKKL